MQFNKRLLLLLTTCIVLTGCKANETDKTEENTVSETTYTVYTTETTSITQNAETTSEQTYTETTVETTSKTNAQIEESPVFTFDETDEILVQGQEFAENYAKMSWLYLYGAAWYNYTNIKYFDFGNYDSNNYFELEYDSYKIPFYKLLITDYTYDELMQYIKSFFTEDAFLKKQDSFATFITGKDNNIYVNANEPTFLFLPRNEPAHILSYTKNSDGTITYNCYAKSDEENDESLYFSFTLNNMKLCSDVFDSDMHLFLPPSWLNEQLGKEKIINLLTTNGLNVTVQELTPIIDRATKNMGLINGYGDVFYQSKEDKFTYLNKHNEKLGNILNSFYYVFSKESQITENYISSLNFYQEDNALLITNEQKTGYKHIGESIFYLSDEFFGDEIIFEGDKQPDKTFIKNEFEITNRTETTLTLINTAYYNDENDNPVQKFEYNMVLEDGTWKFLNFERWY